MSLIVDNSLKNAEALLKEARAVKKTAKAYSGLQRGSVTPSTADRDVSRDIVLSYIGGGRV